MSDCSTTTRDSRAGRVAHGLEGRILGQVLAHVVGEDLVDHHRRDDHRHQHAEREELAGRGLVHPVVDLAGEDRVAAEHLDVGREHGLEGLDRLARPSPAWTLRKPKLTRSRGKPAQRRRSSGRRRSPCSPRRSPRSMGNPPTIVTAWLPSSQPLNWSRSCQPKSGWDCSLSRTRPGRRSLGAAASIRDRIGSRNGFFSRSIPITNSSRRWSGRGTRPPSSHRESGPGDGSLPAEASSPLGPAGRAGIARG